jgi:hypothetical protein
MPTVNNGGRFSLGLGLGARDQEEATDLAVATFGAAPPVIRRSSGSRTSLTTTSAIGFRGGTSSSGI